MKRKFIVLNTIQLALSEAQVTQPQLAKELGVTLNTVNNWCCNRSQPKLANLCQIGEFLDLNPRKLIKFHLMEPQPAPKKELSIEEKLMKKAKRKLEKEHKKANSKKPKK